MPPLLSTDKGAIVVVAVDVLSSSSWMLKVEKQNIPPINIPTFNPEYHIPPLYQ